MGEHQENVEIVDEETGEVIGLSTTALVADIRDYLMSKRRLQIKATEWTKLSEQDQRDEIQSATNTAADLVEAVVDMVAAAGREVIHAKLDNFKIKDGVVTLTAKGVADDGALLSLNHVGQKNLKIIVADAENHDQVRPDVPVKKDQPELPIEGVEESTPAGDTVSAADVNDMLSESDEMSDDEIAEVDQQMSDDDDLQEEAPEADDQDHQDTADQGQTEDQESAPEEGEQPDMPPMALGQQARLRGDGPDENPFDGGTKDHIAWDKGYAEADKEATKVVGDGLKAAEAGEDRHGGKWKEGTDAYRLWMEGYDSYSPPVDAVDDDRSEGVSGKGSDSYGAGRDAAMAGLPRDQNPHEAGTVAHRFWNDGWDAIEPEQVDAG